MHLERLTELLSGEHVADLDHDALEAIVRDGQPLIDQLTARVLDALGEIERRGVWPQSGEVTLPTWLANRTRQSRGKAAFDVRTARTLRDTPVVAGALRDGSLPLTHGQALLAVRNARTEEAFAEAEEFLVELAKPLTIEQLRIALQQWLTRVDPDGSPPDDVTSNTFTIKPVGGRFLLNGDVDGDLGSLISSGVEWMWNELWKNEGNPSRRTTLSCQRRAEALGELIRRGMAAGERDRTPVPSVVVHCRVGDLDDPGAILQTDVGGLITGSTLARYLCDGHVSRVLLGPKSEVLDVGRERRLPTRAQRRAVIARDRTCVVNGCGAAPWLCQVHHLNHWTKGGRTDLDNLVLICRRHHRAVHSRNYHLERDDDGVFEVRWRLPDQPRAPGGAFVAA